MAIDNVFQFTRAVEVEVRRFTQQSPDVPFTINYGQFQASIAQPSRILRDILSLKQLRVEFEIKRTDANGQADTGVIRVYNLNADNRDFVSSQTNLPARSSVDFFIDVRAGHNGRLFRIFSGTVGMAARGGAIKNEREELDWVTTFTISDAGPNIYDTNMDKLFPKGSRIKTALDEIAFNMGLSLSDNLPQALSSATFPTSWSAEGSCRTTLNEWAESFFFNWTVVDGVLLIRNYGEPYRDKPDQQTITIKPETGLIGRVKIGKDNVSFDHVLDGRFQVGDLLKFQTPDFKSDDYMIKELEHSGDNWDGDFITTVTCIKRTDEATDLGITDAGRAGS